MATQQITEQPPLAQGTAWAPPKWVVVSTQSGVVPGGGRATFAADVLKLVTGSASAQILTMLTAPFVARLFAPAAFGTAALFVSITGVISAVVGMRYELSIVLPKKDEEAANAMAVSLCFILLTSGLTAVLVALGGNWILRTLHAPELQGYLWLAPLTVLLNGVFAALSYWATRKKNFGGLTLSQFISVVFFVAAQIGAGLAGHSSGGTIILATLLSLVVATFTLGWRSWPECVRLFVHDVRLRRMIVALKRYSGFPKYSTASAVLNNLGWQMPTFILSAFFSASVVGHYALGNRLLRVPVNLIGVNIATVFFQHASEAHHQGTLRESVDKMLHYLSGIIVFPSLMLGLIGQELFVVMFGSRWMEAGVYTQILSIYVVFWFISIPLGIVLNVLEKQALELRLIVVVLIARLVALFLGGKLGDARLALALFSIAGVSVYGYYCYVVLRHCGVPLSKVARTVALSLATFAPAGLIIGVLKYSDVRPIIVLITAAVLVVLYYWNLIRTDATARGTLMAVVQKFTPERISSNVRSAEST